MSCSCSHKPRKVMKGKGIIGDAGRWVMRSGRWVYRHAVAAKKIYDHLKKEKVISKAARAGGYDAEADKIDQEGYGRKGRAGHRQIGGGVVRLSYPGAGLSSKASYAR
jgi:hypothetical protein